MRSFSSMISWISEVSRKQCFLAFWMISKLIRYIIDKRSQKSVHHYFVNLKWQRHRIFIEIPSIPPYCLIRHPFIVYWFAIQGNWSLIHPTSGMTEFHIGPLWHTCIMIWYFSGWWMAHICIIRFSASRYWEGSHKPKRRIRAYISMSLKPSNGCTEKALSRGESFSPKTHQR